VEIWWAFDGGVDHLFCPVVLVGVMQEVDLHTGIPCPLKPAPTKTRPDGSASIALAPQEVRINSQPVRCTFKLCAPMIISDGIHPLCACAFRSIAKERLLDNVIRRNNQTHRAYLPTSGLPSFVKPRMPTLLAHVSACMNQQSI